jgi:hypothetical protein
MGWRRLFGVGVSLLVKALRRPGMLSTSFSLSPFLSFFPLSPPPDASRSCYSSSTAQVLATFTNLFC